MIDLINKNIVLTYQKNICVMSIEAHGSYLLFYF